MLQTSLRGAVAGAVATVVMTLEQPLDKRLFDSKYNDVEILGKLVTRGNHWQPIGFTLHVQNGAILGAAYARLKPSLPGPAVSTLALRSQAPTSPARARSTHIEQSSDCPRLSERVPRFGERRSCSRLAWSKASELAWEFRASKGVGTALANSEPPTRFRVQTGTWVMGMRCPPVNGLEGHACPLGCLRDIPRKLRGRRWRLSAGGLAAGRCAADAVSLLLQP
jgi:hypothetical protein